MSMGGELAASSTPQEDLCVVPLWDGERQDMSGLLLNNDGGGVVTSSLASVEHTTAVVHSGHGAYRMFTTPTIPAGNFGFVGTAMTGFRTGYVDTRDLTVFDQLGFWIRNDTGAPFTLKLEIKDYHDSNAYRASRTYPVAAGGGWVEITAPLDMQSGWTVEGAGQFDPSRTKLITLLVLANQGQAVSGSIYVDDMVLVEPGGPISPATAPLDTLVEHLAERTFRTLWGSRDRTTALLPQISSYPDTTALNSTAGLVQVLPEAVAQGWVTAAEAHAYIGNLVTALNRVMDQSVYLPPRYMDRNSLFSTPHGEESPADAAFMYLALYRYATLPGVPSALGDDIHELLDRFQFAPFASPTGWKLAYQYDTGAMTAGTYDGYSGEVWVMSLAAHLAGQVEIETLYNSGVNRVRTYVYDPALSHLVHSMPEYRPPFVQWLFPLFVDVADRGLDSYPVRDLATNPLENAVRYQRDVDAALAARGRGSLLQPDAGDDGSGHTYEQFSLYDDYGQPDLFMPWSGSFVLLADPSAAESSLRQMLAVGLHGPFGLPDSVHWTTGESEPYQITARQDLWNTVLAEMAMMQYLYGSNEYLASLPAVDAALDRVFTAESTLNPEAQFLLESANLYSVSSNAADFGSPMIALYTDNQAGGTYGPNIDSAVRVTLNGNDPDAARGTSSFLVTWDMTGPNGYFQFGLGTSQADRPRDIPQFGLARTLRFSAKGDAAGQQVRVNVFRTLPGGEHAQIASRVVTLGTGWAEYALDVSSAGGTPSQLHAVQFVIGDGYAPGAGSFRLDDVRIDTDGFDPLRVFQSYRPEGWADAGRDAIIFPNRSYLYDDALGILALLATDDPEARQTARDVADAILATALADGSYYNERNSGHVLLGDGTPRGPYSPKQTTGDNAWFGLALLAMNRATGESVYLDRARDISDWIEANFRADGPLGGYRGGISDTGAAYPWRSTEHAVDCVALNEQLAAALWQASPTVAAVYAARAEYAANFVVAMYDAAEGKFWTGTGADDAINTSSVPLDVQLWATLALGSDPRYQAAIDWQAPLQWAETHLVVSDGPLTGFTYSTLSTPGKVWLEGVAQGAVVYDTLGQRDKYETSVQTLSYVEATHPTSQGQAVVAASSDTLSDGELGADYDARLHVGATAWTLLARLGVNPLASGGLFFHTEGRDIVADGTGEMTVFRGVNLTGLEYGSFESYEYPGRLGVTYSMPLAQEFDAIAARGMNVVRVPLEWARFVPGWQPGQPLPESLDAGYLALLDDVVAMAAARGLYVIPELHDFLKYWSGQSSQVGVNDSVPHQQLLARTWKLLAAHFADNPAVLGYDLMNEPVREAPYSTNWHAIAQQVVNAIREVDGNHLIFIEGPEYSLASYWPVLNPAPFVTDTLSPPRIVYSPHVYFDYENTSQYDRPGEAAGPVGPVEQYVRDRLLPAIDWSVQYDVPLFFGELGVPCTEAWAGLLDQAMESFFDPLEISTAAWQYIDTARWPYSPPPEMNLAGCDTLLDVLDDYPGGTYSQREEFVALPRESCLYDEPALVPLSYDFLNPWSNGSWGASVDPRSTEQALQGDHSIKVQFQGNWGGLKFTHDFGLDTGRVDTLRFGIYPISADLDFRIFTTGPLPDSEEYPADYAARHRLSEYVAGGLAANQWQWVEIPMADLVPAGESVITGIAFQDDSVADAPFYVDAVSLVPTFDARISLEISGTPFGADAGTSWGGSLFWVSAYVEDLRSSPEGVLSAAFDLRFDSLPITPTGNVVYGPAFPVARQGTANDTAGLIDEAGAATTLAGAGAGEAAPLVAWQFRRDGTGAPLDADSRASFSTSPGEGTVWIRPANVQLAGLDSPVDWSRVDLPAAAVDLTLGDFDGNAIVDDSDLTPWLAHAFVPPGNPGYDPQFDLNADTRVNQFDLALLIPRLAAGGLKSQTVGSAAADQSPADPAAVPLAGSIDRALETNLDWLAAAWLEPSAGAKSATSSRSGQKGLAATLDSFSLVALRDDRSPRS